MFYSCQMNMKRLFAWGLLVLGLAVSAQAQDRIYRCGNEYTNTVSEAQAKTCKLISGGNVTVVPPPKSTTPRNGGGGGAPANVPRVDTADQRARDSDSRMILESELRKSEAHQRELLKNYNNGAPEKLVSEATNSQKYAERVAEMKAAIARNESDIEGIRRELSRLPGANPAPSASAGTGSK